MAIHEWTRLKDGEVVPLERALAAFDMFVLHERDGDFQDVGRKEPESTAAAKKYRWPFVLMILHSNSAAETNKSWINRQNKKLSDSQNS